MKRWMDKYRTQTAGLALAGLALAGFAFPSQAADFGWRQDQEALSGTKGFESSRLPLYERLPGAGKEAVAGQLLERFAGSTIGITTAGATIQDVGEAQTVIAAEDGSWAIQVWGDGTRVSYRNFALLEGRPELWLPVEQRLDGSTLESLGRTFLDRYLGELVKLDEDEKLVPLFTEFAISGGAAVDGSGEKLEERVTASAVVFSRTLGDIPVVGPGSKVAVTFANDGTPVGFDLDWPLYRPRGDVQQVLSVGEIVARSKVLADFAGQPLAPEVEHFECGYYDAGTRRKDATAPIQAGCFVQAKQKRIVDERVHDAEPGSGHVLVARAEAIPAAVSVELDKGWPEVLELLGIGYEPTAELPADPPVAK